MEKGKGGRPFYISISPVYFLLGGVLLYWYIWKRGPVIAADPTLMFLMRYYSPKCEPLYDINLYNFNPSARPDHRSRQISTQKKD